MGDINWTFPGGKLKQEPTSITLVNNTQLATLITVPTGKLWILRSIKVANPDDVNRVIIVNKWKEVAKTTLITILTTGYTANAVGASLVHWPSTTMDDATMADKPSHPEILVAGNTIEVIYAAGGASAGGGPDADGIVIEYLEIDAP